MKILLVDAHPTARVIIVTQYNDHLYREAARRAGAYDYVLKENVLDLPRIINRDAAQQGV